MRNGWFLLTFGCLAAATLLLAAAQPQPASPPPAEDVRLVHAAAAGDASDSGARQALEELKSLGVAAHVVPILSDNRDDRTVLELQRDAVRVLLRAQDNAAIDALGNLLAVHRNIAPGDERFKLEQSLQRYSIDAIFRLARRPSPVEKLDDSASVASLIPATLRTASILKPLDARRTPLPAGDARSGGRAYLHVEKEVWLLGESVLVDYELKNEGAQPLTVAFGGDNRTSPGRSLRFKVLAYDEAGQLAGDPYPSRWSHGGLGGDREIKPGDSFWESIPLWRFCAFTQPGKYTIRVYHDLGWEKTNHFETTDQTNPPLAAHVAPVAEVKITFRQPTPEEAKQVVQHILEQPGNPQRVMGQRSAAFREITSVLAPDYIPVLREAIDQGSITAIEALGIMPVPEATAALLALTAHENAAVAQRAIELLLQRLPLPNNETYYFSDRLWLAPRAWREEFDRPMMALGWQLIDRADSASILQGAQVIEALGQKDGLPRCSGVLDRVIEQFRDDRQEQATYPRQADTSGRVFAAACQLLERGAAPPKKPTTPGNGLVMLRAIKRDEKFRPDGWQDDVRGLLAHEIPYVRATALENLPRPVPEELQNVIVQRLLDSVPPVQVAACNLARELKLKKAVPAFMKMLAEADDLWRINIAYYAAAECGVTPDRLTEICANRLTADSNPASEISQRNYQIYLLLTNIFDKGGGAGASNVDWSVVPQLQTAWHNLVEVERGRIAAGEKLPLGQPPVTTELFPRGLTVSLPDNKGDWPQWETSPAAPRRGGRRR